MKVTITEAQLEIIELNPENETTEIAQNLAALAVTPQGSVPLACSMGMPMNWKDKPPIVAATAFEAEFTQVVDDYESRVRVNEIKTEIDDTGQRIIPTVEVVANGGQ